jgi:protein-disulfide isomerase
LKYLTQGLPESVTPLRFHMRSKGTMRRYLNLTVIVLLVSVLSVAQQKTVAEKPTENSTGKAAVSAAAVNLPSEQTVDGFMQQTFGYDPRVSWKIAGIRPAPVPGLAEVLVTLASPQGQQFSRFYVTADGEHAVVGDIIPFGAAPFAPARKLLDKGITGPARGPKDAPVTIVEFGDLQCPACKTAQPAIESLVKAEPNARFVFQNFPLEMHNWAVKGAAYADCVGRVSNDIFWQFIAKTYEQQADITAENADQKLAAVAEATGAKGADIAACAAMPATQARVDASMALGKSVDVSGTPTLFINGRKIGNVGQIPADMLKQLVEFAGKQGK